MLTPQMKKDISTFVEQHTLDGKQRWQATFHKVGANLEVILWVAIGEIDGADVEELIVFYTETEGFKDRYAEIHTGSHYEKTGEFGHEDRSFKEDDAKIV